MMRAPCGTPGTSQSGCFMEEGYGVWRSIMDNLRFDALTRAMAQGWSRRRALRALGAGAAVGALGLTGREVAVEAAASNACKKACDSTRKGCRGICGQERATCDDLEDSCFTACGVDENCLSTCSETCNECADETDSCATDCQESRKSCQASCRSCISGCDEARRACSKVCAPHDADCKKACNDTRTSCRNTCA